MSNTLVWQSSGNGAKTGTDLTAYMTDLATLITAASAGADFKWSLASSTVSGNAQSVVLKRKDGSAGRILIWGYLSTPAAMQPKLFSTQYITANQPYISYFPNGNTDAPSNLESATGNVMGNDTACFKASANMPLGNCYSTGMVHYYFDSEAGCVFCMQSPSSTAALMMGAGELVVDGLDNAYACSFGTATAALNSLSGGNALFPWQSTNSYQPGDNPYAVVYVNYNGNGKSYYQAWIPSNTWSGRQGANDILLDDQNSRAFFFPIQLLGQTRGEGLALKFRQMAFGPGQIAAFATFNTSGPTTAARAMNNNTAGNAGNPWLVNFKV